MSKIEPVLLSRKETMPMLGGMSYDTFRRLLAEGTIPRGIPIGGWVQWSKAAVAAHLSRTNGNGTRVR